MTQGVLHLGTALYFYSGLTASEQLNVLFLRFTAQIHEAEVKLQSRFKRVLVRGAIKYCNTTNGHFTAY